MATKTATIARPATGETLRGKQKEKDVRMSNIIAAKGTYALPALLQQAPTSPPPPLGVGKKDRMRKSNCNAAAGCAWGNQ